MITILDFLYLLSSISSIRPRDTVLESSAIKQRRCIFVPAPDRILYDEHNYQLCLDDQYLHVLSMY